MQPLDNALFVYPWDVLDDPAAPEEIAALGIKTVTLAAVYHTTRALSPHNPRRKLVHAKHAAAYFAPDPSRYAELRLQPVSPAWMDDPDSFGTASHALQQVGLDVNAWVVVLHNSRLGEANPDLVLQNAFGDRYTYALCPAQPQVRAYARALVADLVSRYPFRALELEACGYMGIDHLSHHEKVGVKLDQSNKFLLSLCFCAACRDAMRARQLDPEQIRVKTARSIEKFLNGETGGTDDPGIVEEGIGAIFGNQEWEQLAAARDDVTFALLDAIQPQISVVQVVPIILAASAWRHQSGACIGADLPGLARRADALFLAPYGDTDVSAQKQIERMVQCVGGQTRVLAGVRACAPDTSSFDGLLARSRALVQAGAQGIRFYQYGLCPRPNLAWIAETARMLDATLS